MAVIAYARTSTRYQSLEVQLEQLSPFDRVYKEESSGANTARPQLEALLDYVREGDTVKVTKIDRLARNTRHLLDIIKVFESKNVTLEIINMGLISSTPTGKLMLTMLGAVAEFERELMLERQAEGIALAKLKGKYKGRKATARVQTQKILDYLKEGKTKPWISKELNVGITSIYRIVRENNNAR